MLTKWTFASVTPPANEEANLLPHGFSKLNNARAWWKEQKKKRTRIKNAVHIINNIKEQSG